MKTLLSRLLLLTSAVTLASFSGQAAIIATDNFNSYTAGSNLAGGTGGTGWNATGWVTSGTGGATVTVESNGGSNAAEFTTGSTANIPNFAYRQLAAPYTGDLVYVSFTLELGQTPSEDFFTLWVDNTSDGSNNHSDTLNTGLLNSTDDLFARPNSPTPIINGPAAASGETYQLVVRYSKSVSGAAQPYNTVSFWVNPTDGDFGSPIGTASSSTNSSLSYIGFRGAANESGNTYWVDNVTLATEWNDVVAVPEPATAALLVGGLALALVSRRRVRS